MTNEAPFSVRAALVRHVERESSSQLGITLRALLRSDRGRLTFWDGNLIVDDFLIQRKYIEGRDQQVVIEAAQRNAKLTPCIGYVSVVGVRPVEGAWLLNADGNVIDPARGRREVEGFLGIALRATEAANWTPESPHRLVDRDVSRQRVAV